MTSIHSLEDLHSKFELLKGNNPELTVQYRKGTEDSLCTKTMRFYQNNNALFIEKHVQNSEGHLSVTQQAQEITQTSLTKEHKYLTTLFSSINKIKPKVKRGWRNFYKELCSTRSKIKFLMRFSLLDSRCIGKPIGRLIAYSANKENTHYKTSPSQILAKTLGPLIFPAGSKKPLLNESTGLVEIDRILYKHYKHLQNYNPEYTSPSGNKFTFHNKDVKVTLREKEYSLETIEANNHAFTKDSTKKPIYIIYFNGNSGCFQQDYRNYASEHLCYLSKKNQPATAIHFNYPNVLNSEGYAEIAKDLIDSGIAQVERLLGQAVAPEDIALHGVSLGGSISSHVAAHFHKHKQTLGALYASRTFASTTQVGRDFFSRALSNNIASKTISRACLPFIKFGTWGSEWDLDTGKAFFSIPHNKREYSVIISSKSTKKQHRKNKEPVPLDDAILGRGLHNSWEKSVESMKIKLGMYGKKEKQDYSAKNHARKMRVFNFTSKQPEPHIDGHASASYTSRLGDTRFRPDKKEGSKKSGTGLLHRTAWIDEGKEQQEITDLDKLHEYEAGTVFCNKLLQMMERTQKQ